MFIARPDDEIHFHDFLSFHCLQTYNFHIFRFHFDFQVMKFPLWEYFNSILCSVCINSHWSLNQTLFSHETSLIYMLLRGAEMRVVEKENTQREKRKEWSACVFTSRNVLRMKMNHTERFGWKPGHELLLITPLSTCCHWVIISFKNDFKKMRAKSFAQS